MSVKFTKYEKASPKSVYIIALVTALIGNVVGIIYAMNTKYLSPYYDKETETLIDLNIPKWKGTLIGFVISTIIYGTIVAICLAVNY